MGKLNFKILKKKGKARAGLLNLNGVEIKTPVFMPVGTKATIKGIILDLLKNQDYLGTKGRINLILANTYHLFLQPGDLLLKKVGGLHSWQNRDGLILTDSGGFQVFSLGLGAKGENFVKLQDDGVWFKSIKDGKKHFFNPKNIVDIQLNLGSDIMMMLDVCAPVHNVQKNQVYDYMKITHKWAKSAYEYFSERYLKSKSVLFPIVQGGLYKDLREQSARFLGKFATDGIAIGGLSVGETKLEMEDILSHTIEFLPEDKPRYLMGVGTPEDLIIGIQEGVDMFDCVLPTRLGRHGTAFSYNGNIKLKNSCYFDDKNPIDSKCNCYVCKNYSRSYLNHLVKEKEMLAGSLISLHNIAFLHQLIEKERERILDI